EDEVLRRITANRQLRREHQLRARVREPLIRAGDLLKVAAQIAHGRVELGKADLHSARQVMRAGASGNCFCGTGRARSEPVLREVEGSAPRGRTASRRRGIATTATD